MHMLLDSSFIWMSMWDGLTVEVGTEETPEEELVVFMTAGKRIRPGDSFVGKQETTTRRKKAQYGQPNNP